MRIKGVAFRAKIHWNKFGFCTFQEKNISLPGICVDRILECAGSPYIFYTVSGKNKFGRLVLNGNESKIVNSVEIRGDFSNGFLFMR